MPACRSSLIINFRACAGQELEQFEKTFCCFDFTQRCDLGVEPFIDIIRDCHAKYPKWESQLQEFHDRQLDAMTVEMPAVLFTDAVHFERDLEKFGIGLAT